MRRFEVCVGFGLCGCALALASCGGNSRSPTAAPVFGADSASIANPYLPVSSYHRCTLGGNDHGTHVRVVRALLGRTKTFSYTGGRVTAAVVLGTETNVNGGGTRRRLLERALDYFARDTVGNVYYIGEDVNKYNSQGRLIGHPGQFRLGRDTQTPGVLMPANPKVGDVFRSETVPAPGPRETDKVTAAGQTLKVGSHLYHNVITIREIARPPREVEHKHFSAGTGVITELDGAVHLISCH